MLYLGRSLNYGYEIGEIKSKFENERGFPGNKGYIAFRGIDPKITLEVGELVEVELSIKKIIKPSCPKCGKPKDKPERLPEDMESWNDRHPSRYLPTFAKAINNLSDQVAEIKRGRE